MDAEDPIMVATDVELFPGDTGRLAEPARRVLVHLLHGPSLEFERHANLWNTLLVHKDEIASRLSELFLELVLDTDLGVAFTRQIVGGEKEFPRLLRRVPLTLIDSVLILHLREQLARAQARSERCVVSRDDLLTYLQLYQRVDNRDVAGFDKRANRAIDNAVKRSFLHRIRNSDGRYEVAATLKLLFAPEMVSALTEQYRKILAGEATVAAVDEDEEEGA